MTRELTREEKKKIRALVVKWCANYDKEYGCLPLECECYMFGKCWTGAYCRYLREAVLPLDPALEVSLLSEGPRPDFKPCPICGGAVPADGRMAYCSESCARIALRRQKRARPGFPGLHGRKIDRQDVLQETLCVWARHRDHGSVGKADCRHGHHLSLRRALRKPGAQPGQAT